MSTLLVLACFSIIGAAVPSPISIKQLQFPFLEGWHLNGLIRTLSSEGHNVSSLSVWKVGDHDAMSKL